MNDTVPAYQSSAYGIYNTLTGVGGIDGLLGVSKWNTTNITYNFPTLSSYYPVGYSGDMEHLNGFSAASSALQTLVTKALGMFADVSNLNFTLVGSGSVADMSIANSADPSTAWAYNPSNGAGGDVWFGPKYNFSASLVGSWGWHTIMHEIGHALGIKHGHEGVSNNSTVLPYNLDTMEYSIMTYRSYVGDIVDGTGYENSTYSYAQSLMMGDIATIQRLYGADYTTNGSNTTYSFNKLTGEMSINGTGQGTPGSNTVFRTVWDGNGVDTYDLSTYSTNLLINLKPGEYSDFGTQKAKLKADGTKIASGNLYNALLNNNDTRSLIENAIGGSGNDTFIGNDANNSIDAGAGNDTIIASAGHDILNGGTGTDTVTYTLASSNYNFVTFQGSTYVLGKTTVDKDTLIGIESATFNGVAINMTATFTFDHMSYLASYRDIYNAYGINVDASTNHFLNNGYFEGRAIDTFQEFQYIASYNDLIGAFGANGTIATSHYVTNGFNEGRSRDNFNEFQYIASYSDLINAFGTNGEVATKHFITNGINEGRSLKFNVQQYLNNYADLQAAFGTNTEAATLHFITNGFNEGRTDGLLV